VLIPEVGDLWVRALLPFLNHLAEARDFAIKPSRGIPVSMPGFPQGDKLLLVSLHETSESCDIGGSVQGHG
jgi:hypothetical protein